MGLKKVAVIGGGSWGTALVKVLHENLPDVIWFIRNHEQAKTLKNTGRNPRYLSFVKLNPGRLQIMTDLKMAVDHADIIVLAIPSAFISETLRSAAPDLREKTVVSAVKGLIPGPYPIIAEMMEEEYQVKNKNFIVISGPSHSEEVGMEKLTYLTFAGESISRTEETARLFQRDYLIPVISDDIYGTEYTAILKNIFAIAAGIAHGLGYGDNFLAVLIANATQEIQRFIDRVHPITRDIKNSAYLGDLLVTAYSQFSRNRALGTMIGKGIPVQTALLEMNQVAEGYYATKGIHRMLKELHLTLPIIETVYSILYEGENPAAVFNALQKQLK